MQVPDLYSINICFSKQFCIADRVVTNYTDDTSIPTLTFQRKQLVVLLLSMLAFHYPVAT